MLLERQAHPPAFVSRTVKTAVAAGHPPARGSVITTHKPVCWQDTGAGRRFNAAGARRIHADTLTPHRPGRPDRTGPRRLLGAVQAAPYSRYVRARRSTCLYQIGRAHV